MDAWKGKVVLVTGASGGLGPPIARALAGEGMRLVLAALPGPELELLAAELHGAGIAAAACPADVTRRRDLERLVAFALAEFGAVDVVVHGAGVDCMRVFHRVHPALLERTVALNLTAVMQLTRLVVPQMLERGRGRIVGIASLAGKAAPPYAAAYAATKAGVIAFTRSLRNEYHGSGVSASVIVPGFVRDAGMYHRMTQATGGRASRLLGTATAEEVARAVIYALRTDAPEVIVNPGPMRVLAGLGEIFPALPGWMARRIGADTLLRGWAEANERGAIRVPGAVAEEVEA